MITNATAKVARAQCIMNKVNPLAKKPKKVRSSDTVLISLLGQFGIANYQMGRNENRGKPDPNDIKQVEKTRNEFLDYLDKEKK
jgi:hypothetical protein